MQISKITSKGQITLPKKIRDSLHLKEGMLIIFEEQEDKIIIKPQKTLKDFRGVLRSKEKKFSSEKIRKEAKEYLRKRIISVQEEKGNY
ncbi:MAG: AbrB/MazE/SpoVT family DNA-binding domain-containing protein [Acidobacteriota bacterium]